MKKFTFLFLIYVANILLLSAQDDQKYLAGAVPEIEGKVLFTREIKVSSEVSDSKLFELVEEWVNNTFKIEEDSKRRVLLSNKPEGYLVAQGDEKLVFRTGLLMLDQATINYQLVLRLKNGSCSMEMRNIRYNYTDYKEPVFAEDMITDKIALSKDKTKLNRYYDKFRTHTIDLVDELRGDLLAHLSQVSVEDVKKESEKKINSITDVSVLPTEAAIVTASKSVYDQKEIPMTPLVAAQSPLADGVMNGYKRIEAEKIPGNIIKMLQDDWTLVTSGKADDLNVMTASWGGLGRFYEKPVSMSFINPTRHTIKTMDAGDTYTISFYTEAYRDQLNYCGSVSGNGVDKIKGSGLTPILTPSGATAFSEAWMIIECKKILSQPISDSSVTNKALSSEWSKDGYHKIFIGEIVNVWIR